MIKIEGNFKWAFVAALVIALLDAVFPQFLDLIARIPGGIAAYIPAILGILGLLAGFSIAEGGLNKFLIAFGTLVVAGMFTVIPDGIVLLSRFWSVLVLDLTIVVGLASITAVVRSASDALGNE